MTETEWTIWNDAAMKVKGLEPGLLDDWLPRDPVIYVMRQRCCVMPTINHYEIEH